MRNQVFITSGSGTGVTIRELVEYVSGDLPSDRATEIDEQAESDGELAAAIRDLREVSSIGLDCEIELRVRQLMNQVRDLATANSLDEADFAFRGLNQEVVKLLEQGVPRAQFSDVLDEVYAWSSSPQLKPYSRWTFHASLLVH